MKIYDKQNSSVSCLEVTEQGINIYRKDNNSIVHLNFASVTGVDIYIKADLNTSSKGQEYVSITGIKYTVRSEEAGEVFVNTSGGIFFTDKQLYKFLSYKKYFPNMRITVNGPQDGLDLPLKIYSKFGINLPLKQKNSIYAVEMYSLVTTGICGYFLYSFYSDIASGYSFVTNFILFFLIPGLVLSSIIVYQEFLKYKIRRIMNL